VAGRRRLLGVPLMRGTEQLAGAALVLALLAGCPGPKLPSDLASAQALEGGGRNPAEALAAWHRIREACARGERPPAAKDACALAASREAELLEQAGRTDEAERAWEQLPEQAKDQRLAARALSRASELALRRGDAQRAVAIAWRCVERYPDEVP